LIANGTVVRGYDPRTGEGRWSLGPNSYITIPTPVVGPDAFYVTGGYQPVRPIYAVRRGASGDLTASGSDAVLWSSDRDGPYIPTPLLYRGLLYTLQVNGVLTAYDSETGEEVYRARVGAGTFTASPVASDGRLYIACEDGRVFVVEAGPEYRELGVNATGEMIMATPAISGGRMYLRTIERIYAIGGV
jgi:outer membrane protein assembly factor BamB